MAAPKKKQRSPGLATRPHAPEDNRSTLDLDQLAQSMPDPGADFRSVVLAGADENELVALGQSFTTEDILVSAPAFVSGIVEQPLTAGQGVLLLGYSPEQALSLSLLIRARDLSITLIGLLLGGVYWAQGARRGPLVAGRGTLHSAPHSTGR